MIDTNFNNTMRYFNKKSDMLSFLMAYNRKFIQKDTPNTTISSAFVPVKGNILADNILRRIYYLFKNPTFTVTETIKDYVKLDKSTMLIATGREFILYSTKTKQEIFRININIAINESQGIFHIYTSYPFDRMVRLTDDLIAFSIVSRSQSVHIFSISQFRVIHSFDDHFGQNHISILKKINGRLITASPKKYFMTYDIRNMDVKYRYFNHLYIPIDVTSFENKIFILDIDHNIKSYDTFFKEIVSIKNRAFIRTNIIAIDESTLITIESSNVFLTIDTNSGNTTVYCPYNKPILTDPDQIERLSADVIVVRNNIRIQLWDISTPSFMCIRDIKYHENIKNMKIVDNSIIVQSTNEVKELIC